MLISHKIFATEFTGPHCVRIYEMKSHRTANEKMNRNHRTKPRTSIFFLCEMNMIGSAFLVRDFSWIFFSFQYTHRFLWHQVKISSLAQFWLFLIDANITPNKNLMLTFQQLSELCVCVVFQCTIGGRSDEYIEKHTKLVWSWFGVSAV